MKNHSKKFVSVLVFALSLVISACTVPQSQQVMGNVSYSGEVSLHSNKNAYLYWCKGDDRVMVAEDPVLNMSGFGIIASTAYVLAERERRKNPATNQKFQYGAAQQAVFMTSLRDTLQKHNVFRHIQIVTTLPKLKNDDILLTVFFKQTRVGEDYEGFPVTLDVLFSGQNNIKKLFTNNYLVYSHRDMSLFKRQGFRKQQEEASHSLLQKIINTLNQQKKLILMGE